MNNFFEKYREYLSEKDYSKLIENSNQAFDSLIEGYNFDYSKFNNYEFSPDQEILIENISFISLCKHHLLPFFGHCSVSYLSSDKIIGFSRIKEVVQKLSKKLTLQEELTKDIFNVLNKILSPKKIKVRIMAKHTCMMLKNISLEEEIVTTESNYNK